jgi:choline dehydrogenase-like flavoprotein
MIDNADTLDHEAVLDVDLCIVGAGAAGIAIALQFLGAATSVLLLAGGGETNEPPDQALYDGEVADPKLHAPANTYRQRRFGGTTGIWGGRCIPFDPIDFEARDYIPGSGWPFGLDTLMPYYPRANAICEAGEFAYRAAQARADGMRPIIQGFPEGDFTSDGLERFSCPTDFGPRYRHKLAAAANIRVLLGASCTEILTRPEGDRVSGIVARTLSGKRLTVRARFVVLAVGGLETPRLLLQSRAAHPTGIGNRGDLVGRNYMCHIAGTLGTVRFKVPRAAIWHGYERSDEGIYCRRRFHLSAARQREMRVGNFVARLHHPRIPDPSHRTGALSAIYLARFLIPYEYRTRLAEGMAPSLANDLRHVGNVVTDPFATAGFLFDILRLRKLAIRKFPSIIVRPRANVFSLDFHSEQEPNPASRVTLTDDRDALGLQRIRIDWRYTKGDIRTVVDSIRLLGRNLEQSGLGSIDLGDGDLEHEIMRDGAYGGHHIGTARMDVSPRAGVVDPECQVHDVGNLFIASSAVFPTSGQANPTLTIVALALRLAERLKHLCGETRAEAWPPLDPVAAPAAPAPRPVETVLA